MTSRSAKRIGGATLTGSAPAKRFAVVLLEVLSGTCSVTEGCRLLGISLTRYYVLETRAVQGLLQALEPRPRGRATANADHARREHVRLEHEVLRLQALVRATQRAVAITPPAKAPARRQRKTAPRATKVIAQLRSAPTADNDPVEAR
jgi:hypothetical protein